MKHACVFAARLCFVHSFPALPRIHPGFVCRIRFFGSRLWRFFPALPHRLIHFESHPLLSRIASLIHSSPASSRLSLTLHPFQSRLCRIIPSSVHPSIQAFLPSGLSTSLISVQLPSIVCPVSPLSLRFCPVPSIQALSI